MVFLPRRSLLHLAEPAQLGSFLSHGLGEAAASLLRLGIYWPVSCSDFQPQWLHHGRTTQGPYCTGLPNLLCNILHRLGPQLWLCATMPYTPHLEAALRLAQISLPHLALPGARWHLQPPSSGHSQLHCWLPSMGHLCMLHALNALLASALSHACLALFLYQLPSPVAVCLFLNHALVSLRVARELAAHEAMPNML